MSRLCCHGYRSRREHDESVLAETYGTPLKAYTDYDKMLADSGRTYCRYLYATPFSCGTSHRRCRSRETPSLLRNRFCLTYEDAKAIRDAVKSNGVKVCVCFECRYSAHFTMIRSVIDNGLLGELHYAEVDYYPRYRALVWTIRVEHQKKTSAVAPYSRRDAMRLTRSSSLWTETSKR